MVYDIYSIGFPLVEIMRVEQGLEFDKIGLFKGPYPSADVCILLDVAAKLGKKCCMSGPVGDDIFGRLVVSRLSQDGVDVSSMRLLEDSFTGVVFVRYASDGTREYLDNVGSSVAIRLNADDINYKAVKHSKWIHFSGEVISTCKDDVMKDALSRLLEAIPEKTNVSLDPNFTSDLTTDMYDFFQPFIERANVVFPSVDEAAILMKTPTDDEACAQLSKKRKIVAYKRGKLGCRIYAPSLTKPLDILGFDVDQVDPTGCGDSFCAGFLYALIENWSLKKAGYFANAVGALQAMTMGPMEGVKSFDEVAKFLEMYGYRL